MCIYVQGPLTDSLSYFVHPRPVASETILDFDNATIIRPAGALALAFNDFPYSPQGNNIVRNGIYQAARPHPSDLVVAYDAARGARIFMDQVIAVGNATAKTVEGSSYVREYVKRGYAAQGDEQLYGYSTCHWIRSCTSAERVGDPCEGTLSNVVYQGFCFRSDVGSLECGHTTALDDAYGESPVALGGSSGGSQVVTPASQSSVFSMPVQQGVVPQTSATVTSMASTPGDARAYRCTTGSPAKSLGYFVSKRMKFAGCMISTDAQYDALAEVHVPDFCAVPASMRTGCLLPAAVNYDPLAKQSGECRWPTKGCLDPSAFNYNSYATVTDQENPCVRKVPGCTVNAVSYAGVTAGTPGYRGGFYGSGSKGSGAGGPSYGLVSESVYNGPAVTNYDEWATLNTGCVVAVEGCMDSSARNYDRLATVNSHTWCVPMVAGCMMPSVEHVASAYADVPSTVALSNNPALLPSGRTDAITANFSASTTLHVPSMCTVARFGCGSAGVATGTDGFGVETALNHDPLATVNTRCYWPRYGCLNMRASNFGCEHYSAVSPCSPPEAERVTVHQSHRCRFPQAPPAPPAPPPPPKLPAGEFETQYVVKLDVSILSTVPEAMAMRGSFETEFRRLASLSDNAPVVVNIEEAGGNGSGGRRLQLAQAQIDVRMSATLASQDEASAASGTLQSTIGTSRDSIQQAFGDAIGVTMLSAASISIDVVAIALAAPAPPPLDATASGSVAIAIGVVALLAALAACMITFYCLRAGRSPKQVIPNERTFHA